MIRHQAERRNTNDRAFGGIRHRREESAVVSSIPEDLRFAVTAVDNVLRYAIGMPATTSRHAGRPSSILPNR
jgi:hypothetical protein